MDLSVVHIAASAPSGKKTGSTGAHDSAVRPKTLYTEFYGFSENPFSIRPDPRFLYLTPAHREALDALMEGVEEQKGLMVFTGDVGAGKTTLLYHLIDQLGETVKTAFIFFTLVNFKQLLRNVLLELGLDPTGEDKVLLINRLSHFLLERAAEGETVVLMIDEAQNLSDEVLEEIRLLSNLETRSSKLLQIVLTGQSELEAKLESAPLRAFNQRISVRRHIGPLTREECPGYLEHRLQMVGSRASRVFSSEAIALICQYSHRIPRVINVICDNALRIACHLNRSRVDGEVVREALRKTQGFLQTNTLPVSPRQREAAPVRTRLDLLEGLLHTITARRREAVDPSAVLIPAFHACLTPGTEKNCPTQTESLCG